MLRAMNCLLEKSCLSAVSYWEDVTKARDLAIAASSVSREMGLTANAALQLAVESVLSGNLVHMDLMNRNFDVIIVGGGPAGSTAAYKLGRSGARVLLLDKATFPREKPCGGGLTARLLDRFPYVRDFLQCGEVPVNPVSRVHLQSPGGTRVTYHQVTAVLDLGLLGALVVAASPPATTRSR